MPIRSFSEVKKYGQPTPATHPHLLQGNEADIQVSTWSQCLLYRHYGNKRVPVPESRVSKPGSGKFNFLEPFPARAPENIIFRFFKC